MLVPGYRHSSDSTFKRTKFITLNLDSGLTGHNGLVWGILDGQTFLCRKSYGSLLCYVNDL